MRLHRPSGRATALGALIATTGAALLTLAMAAGAQQQPTDDHSRQKPKPSAKGIIVLFDGKQEEIAANFTQRDPSKPATWEAVDGAMVVKSGDIMTKQQFTDFQLHVEFKEPYMPDKTGQARGNSGVFLQGRYEIQVLDCFGKTEPGNGDCGAVYGKSSPLMVAYKPPLSWQSYDIIFRGARVDASGAVTEKARVSVMLNGVVLQNNYEIDGVCGAALNNKVGEPGPIILQDHGCPVQYRNVWILPLPAQGAQHY